MGERRRRELEGKIGIFLQKYARKKYPTIDPNDRTYDREVEAMVKRMDPKELAALVGQFDAEDADDEGGRDPA